MGRDGGLIALHELMGQRGALILPHFAHDPGYTNVAQRSFGNSDRVCWRLMVSGLLPGTWATGWISPASKVLNPQRPVIFRKIILEGFCYCEHVWLM